MIHLLGKIYISNDKHIDQFSPKKVIISSDIGELDSYASYEEFTNSKILFSYKKSSSLIGDNGIFKNHLNFFEHLFEEYQKDEKSIILYLDKITTYEFLLNWFKIVLENESFSNILELCKFHMFYNKLYNNGSSHSKFFSSTAVNYTSDEHLSEIELDVLQKNITASTREENLNFLTTIKNEISLELLLSSYLYNKSYSYELKKKTRVFYKTTVDSFLYDLRDVFMLNCLDSEYMKTLGIQKIYDLSNIHEIFDDESDLCRILFNSPIWNSKYFRGTSSRNDGGLLNFQNFNEQTSSELIEAVDIFRNNGGLNDIEKFTNGRKALQLHGISEENFSDDLLDQLIYEEMNQNDEGIVYNPTIGHTVNLLFIKMILMKFKVSDLEFLKRFILKN